MKHKKGQELGRNTILLIIIFLLLIAVLAYFYWQSGQSITFYLDKIFS